MLNGTPRSNFMKKSLIIMLLIAASAAFFAGCSLFPSAEEVAAMSPEKLEAAKADAQALVDAGQVVADSGEYLPWPFDLVAAAAGGALVILGGKKTAKLTKTAATKVIVPAVAAIAGKFLRKDSGGSSPGSETAPGSELSSQNAADLTDFDGNGKA